MIQAIEEASRSVTLITYIFENDRAGRRLLEALRGAVSRGVAVRVLLDDVGARYRWPPMPRALRKAGIPVATLLPTRIPWRFQYSNLRTHRKILVVDGKVGFTGGMNIYEGNCLELEPSHPVQDLHFRVTGPVVAQLQVACGEDWAFCTGELLTGEPWVSALESQGPVLARGISSGPDDDFEKLRLTILGAIACALSSVLVVTPYFLSDAWTRGAVPCSPGEEDAHVTREWTHRAAAGHQPAWLPGSGDRIESGLSGPAAPLPRQRSEPGTIGVWGPRRQESLPAPSLPSSSGNTRFPW